MVVATVVDAAIGWLVGSILEYFTGTFQAWIQGVGLADDVEELKAAVNSVEMVVAAAKGRKIENEPLARSLDHLKELLYDADDVMDELDCYRLKHEVECGNSRSGSTPDATNNTAAKSIPSSIRQLGRTAISNLGRIVSTDSSRKRKREDGHNIAANSHLEILVNKSEFSDRIKLITRKLRDLDRDVSKALGIDGLNNTGTSNVGTYHGKCPTTSYLVEHKVYGRDAEMESIFKLIEKNKSSDITVLPIVGVGGVGKTTLAQIVYKESQFQIKIWICVSDKFDVTRLTKEMLESVSRQKQAETGNLNKLQEDLEEQMKSRRFLIVLDNVWDDMNQNSWDKLLAPLKFNDAMGNMILVTTRKLSVADMTKTIELVRLDALEKGDFWRLFKSCAFGDEEYDADQGFCCTGKKIAKQLSGNPLAAKTVGSLLKRNINVDNWTNILNNQEWKSLQGKGGIMPALKLSYDYLPEHLQQCFRYCCLFPKGYHFTEAELIRIWISQGFVHGSHTGKKQEDAGKEYLADLVNSGFFQHVSYSSHTFVLHDLLHDLACQVSRADILTIDYSECAEISPTIRHLSIVINSAHSEASENFERKLLQITSVKKLRSLVLNGAYGSHFFNCFKNIFKEANTLRFLQIEATNSDFNCFISNLGSCTHVRYISSFSYFKFANGEFKGKVLVPRAHQARHTRTVRAGTVGGMLTFATPKLTKGNVLPQALTKFLHLQVLDVGLGGNPTPPSGMSNLVSMRHLFATEELQSAIANIGRMTALQELSKFKVEVENDSGFDIRQLEYMNQLVQLGIYQLENVQTKLEASEARLEDKVYLEDLCLSWDDASSTGSAASTETATNVLEQLRPYRSLKLLQIIGYNGCSCPSWLATNISVTSLQSLRLEKCKAWGVLAPLHKLLFLRKLELINVPDIVEVTIPCLEELMLIELPRLEKCVATSGSKLLNCHLQSLIIEECPELNDFAPFTSENFCSFEAIQNSGMSQLEIYSAEYLSAKAEKKKWLPVLRILRIRGCPRLILTHPLPPAANTQVSIEGLSSSYPAIKTERFGEFSIMSSNDLEVLDSKILAFQNLTKVTSVDIKHCPNLVFISFEGFMQLNSLERMTISNCGNLVSSCIVPNAVSETWRATTCPAFPHLKHLSIESCGGIAVKWLTEILPHTQSLEQLNIMDFPEIKSISIQEAESGNLASSSEPEVVLPTILAQHEFHLNIPLNILSTLQKFHIKRCPEMQLCGSEGFGGFTSLTDLDIAGCPKLLSSADERFSLPPSIPELRIRGLPKKLQPYFPGEGTFLKKLDVLDSPDLQSLRLHSCTAVECLSIQECRQLAVLEGFEYLSSLRFLSIEMNPELSRAWIRKCQEMERRGGHACLLPQSLLQLSVLCLQDELVPYLLAGSPCLFKLEVCSSPNLTSLQFGSLSALKILVIRDCDSLASLQGCLSELEQCQFWGQDLNSLLPGSFTGLKHLKLSCCTGLASLERHFLGDLISLVIKNCHSSIPALVELLSRQAEGLSIFPRLEGLAVDDLSVLTTSVCRKHLTSLRCLQLQRLKVVHFTDEQEKALQLLTSLQQLQFYWCEDLADLPDVLHSLHSLKNLAVWRCPCISKLPEKGLPPSLEELEISVRSAQLNDQCGMLATGKPKIKIDWNYIN